MSLQIKMIGTAVAALAAKGYLLEAISLVVRFLVILPIQVKQTRLPNLLRIIWRHL